MLFLQGTVQLAESWAHHQTGRRRQRFAAAPRSLSQWNTHHLPQADKQVRLLIKILNQGKVQTRTVLTADEVTGPSTIGSMGIHPLGMNACDFDLAIGPEDGKTYMYFERVHLEVICADLANEYTGSSRYYSTDMPRPGPPTLREGPVHFVRKDKHDLLTSGTTGLFSQLFRSSSRRDVSQVSTTMGDLHPQNRSRTSNNLQITFVFNRPKKKDTYIALADRWIGPQISQNFLSGKAADVQTAFSKVFLNPRQTLTPEETKAPVSLRRQTGLL